VRILCEDRIPAEELPAGRPGFLAKAALSLLEAVLDELDVRFAETPPQSPAPDPRAETPPQSPAPDPALRQFRARGSIGSP
jgi:hypothetical protein